MDNLSISVSIKIINFVIKYKTTFQKTSKPREFYWWILLLKLEEIVSVLHKLFIHGE